MLFDPFTHRAEELRDVLVVQCGSSPRVVGQYWQILSRTELKRLRPASGVQKCQE